MVFEPQHHIYHLIDKNIVSGPKSPGTYPTWLTLLHYSANISAEPARNSSEEVVNQPLHLHKQLFISLGLA